jgi:hypothetical protein
MSETWTPAQRAYIARMLKTIATDTGSAVRERINKMVDGSQVAIDEAFECVKKYVDDSMGDLEKRLIELEQNQFEDAGVYNAASAYKKNHGVTHSGSYWIAQRAIAAGEKPGSGNCWRLAVKAGKDAR